MKEKEIAITAYRCQKCGRIHFPFHDRCLECKAREFEEIHPEGDATLVTYTAIFNLPWGFDQRYLVIGVVEFENEIKAMGQIKVDSVKELRTGMRMKPGWEPIRKQYGEDVYGLKLEPVR
jgi:uncharacterized OB-fold protein